MSNTHKTRVDSATAHARQPVAKSGSIPASTLHFWFGESADAIGLVETFHYSRRWPSNVQMVATAHRDGGLFGNKGPCVAACVFTIPGTRWSEPVLELSRLVRDDSTHTQLTALIAASVRKLRREREWDLIVSFADAQRHHGGIYQAAGWHYHGLRAPAMEGVEVAGEFIPGRSANSRYGTRSPERLKAMGIIALPVWDEGKHLFWKPLEPKGRDKAARLGLLLTPYFKPTAAGRAEMGA